MMHGSTNKVLFMFSSVLILYHYTVNNDHTWCYILSAWFLDTRISTCLTSFQNCVAWQTVLIMKNLQVLEMYSLQVYTMVTECCWNKASGALSHFIFFAF